MELANRISREFVKNERKRIQKLQSINSPENIIKQKSGGGSIVIPKLSTLTRQNKIKEMGTS